MAATLIPFPENRPVTILTCGKCGSGHFIVEVSKNGKGFVCERLHCVDCDNDVKLLSTFVRKKGG